MSAKRPKKKATATVKIEKLSYSKCEMFTNVPMLCPMCEVVVNGHHECSRP